MFQLAKKYQGVWVLSALAVVFSAQVAAKCANEYEREKPTHMYIDNFDGTVEDGETGLVWLRCPVGSTWDSGIDPASASDDSCTGSASLLNWSQALVQAETSTALGLISGSWRLPNKKELGSLLDLSCVAPAININLFPRVGSATNYFLWTSTAAATSDKQAWALSYHTAEDVRLPKDRTARAYLIKK